MRACADVPIAVVCDDLAVLAERDLLERALANLVAYAVTHTHAGSIVLRAAPAAGRVGIERA